MVVTTAQGETTGRIVTAALSAGLAACVQVLPIRSHYVWQGELRDEAEDLLLLKAKADDWEALRDAIRQAHAYETPEILRFDADAGSQDYLDWIVSATRKTS